MEAGVQHPDHAPALGHVAQLADGAQVPEEAARLLAIAEAQQGVNQRVDVRGLPVLSHRYDPSVSRRGWVRTTWQHDSVVTR